MVEDAVSGAKIALFRLSATPLPSCLWPGMGWPATCLLWYWLSPLFCEQALQCLRLGLFMRNFSLSFFFSLSEFGLLSHIRSLRKPSGHSGLVVTLSNAARASLFSPSLLVADMSIWASSVLGVAIRQVICGFYLFIYFSSRLCCSLRFQNSPQTHW